MHISGFIPGTGSCDVYCIRESDFGKSGGLGIIQMPSFWEEMFADANDVSHIFIEKVSWVNWVGLVL
jgi:hypothetical protein